MVIKNRIVKLILIPFSWVYGFITSLRNLLYDQSILKSYHPEIPVIVVGNMIAGGTGKTPVVAWIVRELSSKYRVAVLSRGYGRRTRGFLLLNDQSIPETVGDEPMELRLLLPGIPIAVDRNRKRGIQNLASGTCGKIDLILMDDGFQHRRITPGYSIILDDFNRPMNREKLLPAGLLREALTGLKRADLIIETKKHISFDGFPESPFIILVTGIANPQPLADHLSKTGMILNHLKYPDHHRYTRKNAITMRKLFFYYLPGNLPGNNQSNPVLLTTGKDFVKLSRFPELSDLPMRWIPMGPPVDPAQQQIILNKIYHYVEQTHRNR